MTEKVTKMAQLRKSIPKLNPLFLAYREYLIKLFFMEKIKTEFGPAIK